MSEPRIVVLLVAMEPGISIARLLTTLELLGLPKSTLDGALADRRLCLVDGGVDVVDPGSARISLRTADNATRRAAHLALACAVQESRTTAESRVVFERLLRQAGAPVRTVPLTGRERYVAELAATGATSREIAAATYLSPKTVEHHLSRIYRKLGVRSKSELAWSYASYVQVVR